MEKYNWRCERNWTKRCSDPSAACRQCRAKSPMERLLHVAIEHRLMHAETLAYLLHNLPVDRKIRAGAAARRSEACAPAAHGYDSCRHRDARASRATMPAHFGWDNEFGEQQVDVPAFRSTFSGDEWRISEVRAGRRLSRTTSYWKPEDWEWNERTRSQHPHFWAPQSSSPRPIPTRSGNTAACSDRFRCRFPGRFM